MLPSDGHQPRLRLHALQPSDADGGRAVAGTGSGGARRSGGVLVAVLLLAVGVACGGEGDGGQEATAASSSSPSSSPSAAVSADDPRAPGTIRTAERLDELLATVDLTRLPYANSLRVKAMRAVDVPDDPRAVFIQRFTLGRELLRAGRTEEAVEFLEEARELLESGRAPPAPPRVRRELRQLEAVAWLRLGEQENCLSSPSVDPCLVLPGKGPPHADPRGSRTAIRRYRAILREHPDDLGSRWLLNLAYMTLGLHPDSVPERWRIPGSAFASDAPEGAVKPFVERASELGIDVTGQAGGGVVDDFDADGDLDVMASSMGFRDSLRYFENAGDGTFVERTRAAGLGGLTGGLNLAQADYDGDGCLDVLVLRGGWKPPGWPNSLLRGGCDGTFADVSREAGVYSEHRSQTAAWGDYDNDGDLDLFIGNETSGGRGRAASGRGPGGGSRGSRDGGADEPSPQPAELYRNEGDGTFTEVASRLDVAVVGFVKGAAWGDYDNDGWIDLYVSQYDGPNLLYRNLGADADGGHRGFREVGGRAGVREPGRSFPLWWWDYDNDGWLDLFVAGYGALSRDVAAEYLGLSHDAVGARLYRNLGAGPDGTHRGFEDVTDRAGLGDRVMYAMGSNYGDLDNDGWPDFYVGTGDPDYRQRMPSRVFRNAEGRAFQDVTVPGAFGHLFKGHAGSFADVDADGDQDLYIVYGGAYEGDVAPNVLLENPGHGNAWITLRLRGAGPEAREGGSNRFGVGSRVKVTVETPSGTREIHHLVGTGGSFGANSLQAEIGLGDATRIRELEVRWAGSDRRDVWTDVPLDRVLRVREGAAEVEPLEVGAVSLGGGDR